MAWLSERKTDSDRALYWRLFKYFQYCVDEIIVLMWTAVPRPLAIGLLFGAPFASLRNKVKSARIVVFSSLIDRIVAI
jgi:hypothetical protein